MVAQFRKVTLSTAIDEYKEFLNGELENTYAVLYAPNKCYLAVVDQSGRLEIQDNVDKFDLNGIFEARVFNQVAELRWLNELAGKGSRAVISDASFPNAVGTIRQTYLMWGRSTGQVVGDWTQFAEARIGAYLVPLKNIKKDSYARFTAIEYLDEYHDGNVAVTDERLTGIEIA